MKRLLALFVAATLLLTVSSCSVPAFSSKGNQNVLTISIPDRDMSYFIDTLRKEFPDINFEIDQYAGINGTEYLRNTLLHNDASDLFMYTYHYEDENVDDYLADLSGYGFITNFDPSILGAIDIDGRIYQVPGPVAVRCMAYNKTLFEEKGWKVPESCEELVSLCKQIRAKEDDITPIAMGLGGVGYAFTTVTTLSQAGFLSSPSGLRWEKEFKAGKASAQDGFAEGLAITADLIDAGAFAAEKYLGKWDAEAAEAEFTEGKAAMFVIWGSQSKVYQALERSEYEYGFFPFFGDDIGEEVIGIALSSTWSISKRLTERGNEKKLENALRVLEWISSPDGQEALRDYIIDEDGKRTPDPSALINLRNYESTSTDPYLGELRQSYPDANEAFMLYDGYEAIIVDTGDIVQEAMLAGDSKGMAERFVETADKLEADAAKTSYDGIAIGSIAGDFTKEETAQLLANVIMMQNYGDFALVTCAGTGEHDILNRSGAAGKLYGGDLFNSNYNTIVSSQGKTLEVLDITGSDVKRLLSYGKTLANDENRAETAEFPYYWAGIDVTMRGTKAASVVCSGRELQNDQVYRVVVTKGDYPDSLADFASPVDEAALVVDIWKDYLMRYSPIKPPIVMRK